MTKRADGKFRRIERDKYRTPPSAIDPLLPHLPPHVQFIEPCAGDYRMAGYLTSQGHICTLATDIEPDHPAVSKANALDLTPNIAHLADYFITNPPWDRVVLHALIRHLPTILPTWLLFDADWMHNVSSAEMGRRCRKIVSVGRVKWMEGSEHVGFDNCAWYLFDAKCRADTEFYWRG